MVLYDQHSNTVVRSAQLLLACMYLNLSGQRYGSVGPCCMLHTCIHDVSHTHGCTWLYCTCRVPKPGWYPGNQACLVPKPVWYPSLVGTKPVW